MATKNPPAVQLDRRGGKGRPKKLTAEQRRESARHSTANSPATTANFLQIATEALARNFSVIPLQPASKVPVPGFGATKKSKDPAVVLADWAERFPDANIGIVADEDTIILDVDDVAGWQEFRHNISKFLDPRPWELLTLPDPPRTFTVESSPGKAHYYYHRPANWVGNLELGLGSLRAENQYVVGAGSIHPKTGEPYKVIDDSPVIELEYGWLRMVEEVARVIKREVERITRNWDGVQKVPEGMRQYFLRSEVGKLWDGKKDEDQLFAELSERNEKFCDPPKEDHQVLRLVNWVMDKEPYEPGPKVIFGSSQPVDPVGPRTPRSIDPAEHIVPPKDDSGDYEGWFFKGEVNLVSGASGSAKTTIMLQILENLRQGEPIFSHPACRKDYRVVMHDRSARSFKRTARRMKLSQEAEKRIYRLSRTEQQGNAVDVLDRYLKKLEVVPDVLFVEGLDFWVPNGDVNDLHSVQDFLGNLQELAELWDVAIIGSVGSPKQKPKEKYQLHRDNVFGSVAWGRKSETILHVQLSNPEDPNSARDMVLLPRNGKAEPFKLTWQHGRLEEAPLEKAKEPLAGTEETKAASQDQRAHGDDVGGPRRAACRDGSRRGYVRLHLGRYRQQEPKTPRPTARAKGC